MTIAATPSPTRPISTGPLSARDEYYARIGAQGMAPLWESLHALVPKTPATSAEPAHWRYDEVVRPLLMEAGNLITAQEEIGRAHV